MKPGHLGLVSVRERFQAMGGRVEVASAVGRGTTVTLVLPLVSSAETTVLSPAAGQRADLPLTTPHVSEHQTNTLIRVLLVDDHRLVRQGLREIVAADDRLRVVGEAGTGDVVEFGCGYGTFTIPAARRSRGTVHAIDLDPEMLAVVQRKVREEGRTNVRTVARDFAVSGTGLPDDNVQYAMLFNILHAEDPQALLREARRVLAPGGLLGIMHWNYDTSTPRGPSLEIRPRPEQCERWAIAVGFERTAGIVSLPPFHYGMVVRKPPRDSDIS